MVVSSQPVSVLTHNKQMEKSHFSSAHHQIPEIPSVAAAHYSLGFSSLGVFPATNGKPSNFNYGNTYNSYAVAAAAAAEANSCSYLSANYCPPGYNNFNALKFKPTSSTAPTAHAYLSM